MPDSLEQCLPPLCSINDLYSDLKPDKSGASQILQPESGRSFFAEKELNINDVGSGSMESRIKRERDRRYACGVVKLNVR